MATILSVTNDKVLEFTTSQTLLRKMDIDPAATEVRMVLLPFLTGSAGGGTEQFASAVNKETWRFGFTDGNTLVSGSSNTVLGVGVKPGDTSIITLLDGGSASKLLQNVKTVWDFAALPVSQSNFGGDGAAGSQFGLKASDTQTSIYGIRMWKSGSLDLFMEFRNQSNFGSVPDLPVSDSTIIAYCNSFTACGPIQRSDKFTFTSTSDRDIAFGKLNTFCWSWPFSTYKVRLASTAYKVVS